MKNASIALALVSVCVLATGCLPPAISDGKFYTYCPATTCPPDQIADVNASPVGFTDGTKLTDGVVAQPGTNNPTGTWYWGSDAAGQHPERDKWIEWGWDHNKVAVVVDLGKSYSLSHFSIDSTSYTPYGIAYPSEVSVYVSDTDPNPGPASNTYSATLPSFPANCSSSCPESWLIPRTTVTAAVPAGTTVTGRYVKFRITVAGAQVNTLVDEVTVRGAIDNPQRFVPATNQVYHGAYSVNPPDAGGPMNPSYFQNLVGKNLASYIWYDGFNPATINHDLQIFQIYAPRAMQLGWEPSVAPAPGGTVADAVINGSWDAYIEDFFTTFAANLGTGPGQLNTPLFLRFAAEMNGSWTTYGGYQNNDPGKTNGPQKYVAMWRRVYNIAQQLGATNPGHVLFVWAPGSVSYPNGAGNEWNSFVNYYPGDQYVEWVGVDMYSGTPDNRPNEGVGYEPSTHIQPIYDAYASRKPMMLAETGGCPSIPAPLGTPNDGQPGNDKATYVNHLFSQLNSSFPNVRAVYWFNAYDHNFCDFALNSSQDVPLNSALNAYKAEIANSRYVSTIQGN